MRHSNIKWVRGLRTERAKVQPHSKACDCSVCKAAQRAVSKVISTDEFIRRAKPVETLPLWLLAKLGKAKAIPEDILRRRLRGKTLSRYLSRG